MPCSHVMYMCQRKMHSVAVLIRKTHTRIVMQSYEVFICGTHIRIRDVMRYSYVVHAYGQVMPRHRVFIRDALASTRATKQCIVYTSYAHTNKSCNAVAYSYAMPKCEYVQQSNALFITYECNAFASLIQ